MTPAFKSLFVSFQFSKFFDGETSFVQDSLIGGLKWVLPVQQSAFGEDSCHLESSSESRTIPRAHCWRSYHEEEIFRPKNREGDISNSYLLSLVCIFGL